MNSDLHGLTRGLTTEEEERTFGIGQDFGRSLDCFMPCCRSQASTVSAKRFPDSVRAYDLLELGIAHLAGILDR
jgi:hypothetical protein